MDHFQDLRSEMILTMERLGIEIEVQHHEVASGGQAEIDMRYDTLLRDGRQADALQVRGEERRAQRRVLGDVHAEALVPGQRVGDALPPVAVAAAASRSSTPRPVTPDCPTSGGGTSAGCSSMRRRCLRSPRRRRTPTSASSRVTRRRSTSCTPSGTARPRAGSRCTRRARRPSGSSSAAPTRRATLTSRSRRC